VTEEKGKGEQAKHRSRPWRENIEAVTMAIVMAVLLKYFVVEAYKIPTGSMQPTLMGNTETNIHDRILVDKFSYHYRDPERFEVAVFRYPLDRSKNFIKRILGMPGEWLRIQDGDLFVRASESDPESDPWRILRRPRPIQREMLKELDSEAPWQVDRESRGWKAQERTIEGEGPGAAVYPEPIKDYYTDGYPGAMPAKMKSRIPRFSLNDVGDVRLEGRVAAREDCTAVEIELHEGSRRYTWVLPGPAAPPDAVPRIETRDESGRVSEREVQAASPWRLRAGRKTRFAAQNLDDLLELSLDGKWSLELEVPGTSSQSAKVWVRTSGGGARLDRLTLFRDVYYTSDRASKNEWEIPEGHYFMLGDNTQDSADSREWSFARFQLERGDGESEILRGNLRERENPLYHDGSIYLRDEFGELHVLPRETPRIHDASAPTVPRHLITGRALLVFWPLRPSLGVYRLKWIH